MAEAESPADLQLYSVKDLGHFQVLGLQEHEADVGRSGIPWKRKKEQGVTTTVSCPADTGDIPGPRRAVGFCSAPVWSSDGDPGGFQVSPGVAAAPSHRVLSSFCQGQD